MSNENQVIVKKGGFGKFLLGFFLGFIFFFVAVAGVGFYAYKKVSIKNIENTIGISIPVYEELKTKPLEKVINLTIDLAKDRDSLTLSKVEDTFGIMSSLTGNTIPVGIKNTTSGFVYVYSADDLDETYLDISLFSNTKVSALFNEAKDFATNLSLSDLQKLATFTLPDIAIINNVKNLPLMEALEQINQSLNFETLTLRDLNTQFGIDLTGVDAIKDFLDIPFNGEGNNNLAYALNNAKIANFVGLSQQTDETDKAYEYRLQQAGIMGAIAKYKISELQTNVNNLTLGKVMGLERKYIRTGSEGSYSYELETEADYNQRILDAKLLGALKDAKINNLQSEIENLHIRNQTLSQLEDWGLVDLSGLDALDRARISSKTISEIIEEYAILSRSI